MNSFITFTNAIFVIEGPLHVRIHNLLQVLLIAKAYRSNCCVKWIVNEDFPYELEDVYQIANIGDIVIDSLDIVLGARYYYNPSVQIEDFIANCVATNHIEITKERYPNIDHISFDWIVFDNIGPQTKSMIHEISISKDIQDMNIKIIKSELLLSIQIEGYVNLFMEMEHEEDFITIVIYKDDNISEYIPYLDKVDENTKMFVVFEWCISESKRHEISDFLRNYYDDRCVFVIHETHTLLIEYMCLRNATFICTLNHFDENLQSSIDHKYTTTYLLETGHATNLSASQVFKR